MDTPRSARPPASIGTAAIIVRSIDIISFTDRLMLLSGVSYRHTHISYIRKTKAKSFHFYLETRNTFHIFSFLIPFPLSFFFVQTARKGGKKTFDKTNDLLPPPGTNKPVFFVCQNCVPKGDRRTALTLLSLASLSSLLDNKYICTHTKHTQTREKKLKQNCTGRTRHHPYRVPPWAPTVIRFTAAITRHL